MDSASLLACAADRWAPRMGDPTLWGWATVAAYAGAAMLSAIAAGMRSGVERWFWIAMAVAMATLAVNKQLDLQSAVTAIGRCVAQAQGWYDERRRYQLLFVLILGWVGIVLTVGLVVLMRRHLRRVGLAVVGIGIVATFVIVRAVGFHHVDGFLHTRALGGLQANVLLELPGIVLIGTHALFRLTPARGHSRTPARRSAAR